MKRIKALARAWLPPAVATFLRQRAPIDENRLRLEGEFPSWEAALTKCDGYAAPNILDNVLAATLKVKRGEAEFERDSIPFDRIEYSWPVVAGLMWTAARCKGQLNVLDFGGSLGSSYFQHRKFLNSIPSILWNVVEQDHFARVGRAHIADEQLRFYPSISECLAESRPNVILLSSVLQYVPDPWKLLTELTAIQCESLIIDRTSFSAAGDGDTIRLQHVPEGIYKATYPCRVFNELKLLAFIADRGYGMLETFDAIDNFDTRTCWRGHLFHLGRD